MRPDLDIHPLRGNVDTRLRKLEGGDYQAIVLAAAGLKRLGATELIREFISPNVMCPAPGQGALAIEIRAGEVKIARELQFLDHRATRVATTCERALLAALGGGCQVPVGALAETRDGRLHLDAVVARPDGTKILRASGDGDDPIDLGKKVSQALLEDGAHGDPHRSVRVANKLKHSSAIVLFRRPARHMHTKSDKSSLRGLRVLAGRARHQASALSSGLRDLGAEVIEIPFIEIRKPRSYSALDAALNNLQDYDWLILTSVNGVEAVWDRVQNLGLTKRECAPENCRHRPGDQESHRGSWPQGTPCPRAICCRVRGRQPAKKSERKTCAAGSRQSGSGRHSP